MENGSGLDPQSKKPKLDNESVNKPYNGNMSSKECSKPTTFSAKAEVHSSAPANTVDPKTFVGKNIPIKEIDAKNSKTFNRGTKTSMYSLWKAVHNINGTTARNVTSALSKNTP